MHKLPFPLYPIRPDILGEIGSRKLATLANYQPELEYPVGGVGAGPHVLAVVFFTPEEINGTRYIDVEAGPEGYTEGEGIGLCS